MNHSSGAPVHIWIDRYRSQLVMIEGFLGIAAGRMKGLGLEDDGEDIQQHLLRAQQDLGEAMEKMAALTTRLRKECIAKNRNRHAEKDLA